MLIAIYIEVDEGDPSSDPDHSTGITNEAYERLTGESLRWLGSVQDVEQVNKWQSS